MKRQQIDEISPEDQPVDKKQKMDFSNESFSGYDLSLDPLYPRNLVEDLTSKKRFRKPQLEKAVKELLNYLAKKDEKELLPSDYQINLQIGFIDPSKFVKLKFFRIPLRNPYKNKGVCVFVKDPEDVSRDGLAKISEIKEVISVKRLKQEFPDNKDIKNLKNQYDLFLGDLFVEPILREVLAKGGKAFAYDSFPIMTKVPTDLRHTSNLIHSSYYCSPKDGLVVTRDKGRVNVPIGLSSQTQGQLIENIYDTLARFLSKTTWENIESLGVTCNTGNIPPLVFYRCPQLEKILNSSNGKSENENIEMEVETKQIDNKKKNNNNQNNKNSEKPKQETPKQPEKTKQQESQKQPEKTKQESPKQTEKPKQQITKQLSQKEATPKKAEKPKQQESPKQQNTKQQQQSPRQTEKPKQQETPKKAEKTKQQESPKQTEKAEKTKQQESPKQQNTKQETPKKAEKPKQQESPKQTEKSPKQIRLEKKKQQKQKGKAV